MELRFRVTRKAVGLLVAALALVATGAAIGVTSNAYTDANGIYTGCVDRSSGILRVLTPTGQTCRNNEVAIDWNQVGPQGPQGPQGEKGDSAATTIVTRFEVSRVAAHSSNYVGVDCAAGERATGGGGWTPGSGVYMTSSYPSRISDSPTGWRASFENTSDWETAINAFAVCESP